ncbi:molybdopterin molybdotransferase MoeA [Limnoglobus roseus]|uniref:Molybdopterin molybdenumtransferase n=1 Tax=Limnoglobus roseus TaxID=2598579 RepID=A0A5C1A9P3_9BACT|nr:gephyrin-like molybdotransferase Glp [Limnoglobus roseus]QEL13844.1 molybdopterin molybdenumtransferase MoeA [Limnoglobus roseus]
MLEVSAAREIVLRHAKRLKADFTALMSSSLGQVIAADVASDVDSPPFDKSLMDGYAVRAADVSPTAELTVVEEIPAGKMPTKTVGPGEAVRLFTGAPIPPGADAVVMREKTDSPSADRVVIREVPTAGQFILRQATEMKVGETVIPAGTVLTPATFGLLASVGKTTVPAYPQPKVAVVATGDELVEPNRRPKPGQIRNSNGPMLTAQVALAGGLPRYIGIATDREDVLRSYIAEGLEIANVLILAGGVSAGDFDLVPKVLKDCGVTAHFHHVKMKPGKPLLFGTKGDKLVFGLPGNPVSSFVGFELFVKPALRVMGGHIDPPTATQKLTLSEPFAANNNRPTYHPAKRDGDGVRGLKWFGSPDLRAMLDADAFLVLPPGEVNYAAGAVVEVLPINRTAS